MLTENRILEILQRKQPRHPANIAREIFIAGRTFTQSRWLDIQMIPRRDGLKTDTWHIYNKDAGVRVGIIKWYGSFKCYSFFPEPGMVFEPTCLTDITNFIHTQMREWEAKRKIESGKIENGK